MTPVLIFLMRHAEKPLDPRDPNLSDAGKARADALSRYIAEDASTPDFLFASAASKHSVRSIQTLTPLSEKLGLPINTGIADQDYQVLSGELLSDPKFAGKVVLICWHHGNLPGLALDLNAPESDVPNPWDSGVFNLILKLDYSAGSIPFVTPITEPF